jgi:NAD-dependent DNA ligase
VVLGGVRIEYATGFNAGYIRDHRIGVGAMVRVVRSGDVIPHILEVMEPAVETMMPEHRYGWKGVDAVLEADLHADDHLFRNHDGHTAAGKDAEDAVIGDSHHQP